MDDKVQSNREEIIEILLEGNLVRENTRAPKNLLIDLLITTRSTELNVILS